MDHAGALTDNAKYTPCNQSQEHASASKYRYEPLPNSGSIRILTLYPGQGDEPLTGTLDFIDIDSSGSYEPISYVWGLREFDHAIWIRSADKDSGSTIGLTRSLFEALRRFRCPDRQRRLWADQICVDQENVAERSQQVQFMNTIYRNASRVLVWLGTDDHVQAKSAFEFVHKLARIFEAAKQRPLPHVDNRRELKIQIGVDWKHLDNITKLVWFTRGWVVQEIGTKAPAVMFWGDEEVDWLVLAQVCEELGSHHHLRAKFKIRSSDIKYHYRRFVEPDMTSHHANRVNFIYELQRARGLRYSDDRDRVFAWLGHFSASMSGKEIATLQAVYDNGWSVVDVYIDVATRSLKSQTDDSSGIGLIALAAVQHKSLRSQHSTHGKVEEVSGSNDRNSLPSWVPDWRIFQSFILSEPISPHRAHGNTTPKLSFEQNGLLLRIQGVEVDSVQSCSRLLLSKEFHVDNKGTSDETAIQYIWQTICEKDRFNFQDKYLNGEEALFACMQTLSNGCVQIAGREKRQYHNIPKVRWLEEEALYLLKALDKPEEIAPDVLLIAGRARFGRNEEQWSRSASAASKNRRFARTCKGYYILGPAVMEQGDIICVLLGGKQPFCLRPIGDQYQLLGECYAHGLMGGEAIDMLDRQELATTNFGVV